MTKIRRSCRCVKKLTDELKYLAIENRKLFDQIIALQDNLKRNGLRQESLRTAKELLTTSGKPANRVC